MAESIAIFFGLVILGAIATFLIALTAHIISEMW